MLSYNKNVSFTSKDVSEWFNGRLHQLLKKALFSAVKIYSITQRK